MVFRFILVFTVILSIQYIGNGQNSKNKFGLGIQTEFSIMPSYQYVWNGSDYSFNKPTTSRFYEIGLVSTFKLSRRFDLILGTEYRKLNSFSHSVDSDLGTSSSQRTIELRHWNYDFKSNAISITLGLSYEVFKFSKFDITFHAASAINVLLSSSIDFQYLTTEYFPSNGGNTFQSVLNETPPNYVINKKFNSIEAGIGIKFNKFSYQIMISGSNENLGGSNTHYGCRIRYMFL